MKPLKDRVAFALRRYGERSLHQLVEQIDATYVDIYQCVTELIGDGVVAMSRGKLRYKYPAQRIVRSYPTSHPKRAKPQPRKMSFNATPYHRCDANYYEHREPSTDWDDGFPFEEVDDFLLGRQGQIVDGSIPQFRNIDVDLSEYRQIARRTVDR